MNLSRRRLKEFKDTMSLFIMTLDLNTRTYPIISHVHSLPYDCLALLPCPTSYGGVIVLAANSIFHVDQTGRIIAVPSNGWASRITDMKLTEDLGVKTRNIALEGARIMFVDERTIFVFSAGGLVYPVEVVVEGRAVTSLIISPPIVQLTIPTTLCSVGSDHLFVGSTVGPSLLLKTFHVLEEVRKSALHSPVAIGEDSADIDMDLDDGESLGFEDSRQRLTGGF
jgi:cleavage and polyadenylation specificity factor subunit 1